MTENEIELYVKNRSAKCFIVGYPAKFKTEGMTRNTVTVTKVSEKLGYPSEVTVGKFGRYRVSRHELRHLTDQELKIHCMIKDGGNSE